MGIPKTLDGENFMENPYELGNFKMGPVMPRNDWSFWVPYCQTNPHSKRQCFPKNKVHKYVEVQARFTNAAFSQKISTKCPKPKISKAKFPKTQIPMTWFRQNSQTENVQMSNGSLSVVFRRMPGRWFLDSLTLTQLCSCAVRVPCNF